MFLLNKAEETVKKFFGDIEELGKDTERTAVALWNDDKEQLKMLSERFGKKAAVGATVIALQKTGVCLAKEITDCDITDTIVEAFVEPSFLETVVVGTAAVMAAAAKVRSDEELQKDIKDCASAATEVTVELIRRMYHA